MQKNTNEAAKNRVPAPKNGSSSRFENLTATKFRPPMRTMVANAKIVALSGPARVCAVNVSFPS